MEILRPNEVLGYLEHHTHSILKPDMAELFVRILGIQTPPPFEEISNPNSDPKGAMFPPDKTITGTSVFSLVPFICEELGLSTTHNKMGRGSAVKVLVARIRTHLGIKV